MTFEPFHCTFVGDTNGFEVSPTEGTLARRGGEPTVLDVSYLGKVSWPVVAGRGRRGLLMHLVTYGRVIDEYDATVPYRSNCTRLCATMCYADINATQKWSSRASPLKRVSISSLVIFIVSV